MIDLVSKINGLGIDEKIDVVYNGVDYSIECYYIYSNRKSFAMNNRSEHGILSSMNIEKITNNFITFYSYDMFGNKNTARIKVADITIKG
jgi:hypothetical protein